MGEMACGYADGGLSLEEAMLFAYHRGRAIEDAGLNRNGAMAAVGLTWQQTVVRYRTFRVFPCFIVNR